MSRTKTPDTIAWADHLATSTTQASNLRTGPTLGPEARCLCGSDDTRGRILAQAVDLADAAVSVVRNEGTRFCQGCHHAIHHGAMSVRRHYTATSNVRDTYHPACCRI